MLLCIIYTCVRSDSTQANMYDYDYTVWLQNGQNARHTASLCAPLHSTLCSSMTSASQVRIIRFIPLHLLRALSPYSFACVPVWPFHLSRPHFNFFYAVRRLVINLTCPAILLCVGLRTIASSDWSPPFVCVHYVPYQFIVHFAFSFSILRNRITNK